MNKENREKVLKFVKEAGDAPIRFGIQLYKDYYGDRDRHEDIKRLKELRKTAATLDIIDLIREILALSECFGTRYVKAGREQCAADTRRSCLDIWRIIVNYRDDIDIFNVMHALYKLTYEWDDVTNDYCDTIHRRTFIIDDDGGEIYDEDEEDEFGLLFEDWKDI